jgi:hypothetical protein
VFENFGLDRQAEFFEQEAERLGHPPPVVDANDVLADPRGVLSRLCAALEIPFEDAMLRWPEGSQPTDGPWAPHWYGVVEKSSGFGPPERGLVQLEPEDRKLADRCRPHYERLAAHRIRSAS